MKVIYYFDMDNVLANFDVPNALERFDKEKGFFENLPPIKANVKMFNKMLKQGMDARIITASPNEQADFDKMKWVKKHIPNLPLEQMEICRVGENKAAKIQPDSFSILFDDYSKNCNEWEDAGGTAVKIIQKNSKGKNFKGYRAKTVRHFFRQLVA